MTKGPNLLKILIVSTSSRLIFNPGSRCAIAAYNSEKKMMSTMTPQMAVTGSKQCVCDINRSLIWVEDTVRMCVTHSTVRERKKKAVLENRKRSS